MAITLRNKALEAKIREIGRRTGEGTSATIARIVALEEARLDKEERSLVAERAKAIKRSRAMLPKLAKAENAAIRQAFDDIYREDGLPR
jgi:hypothetical protein